MANIIKVLASERAVNSTATSVNSASLVRLVNTDTGTNALITQKYANGDTISTFTLPAAGRDESVVYLMKEPDETVSSNSTAVVGVSVGFY